MGLLYIDIMYVLDHNYTSQIRIKQNSLNLSRTLSFPNKIEELENHKEEDKDLEVSNQD